MQDGSVQLPDGNSLRLTSERDYADISAICAAAYPTEPPYSRDELAAQRAVSLKASSSCCIRHGAQWGTNFTIRSR